MQSRAKFSHTSVLVPSLLLNPSLHRGINLIFTAPDQLAVHRTISNNLGEHTYTQSGPPLRSAVDTPRHRANGHRPRESSTSPTPRKKKKEKNSPPPPHTQFQPTAGLVPGKMKTHTITHPSPGSRRGGRKKEREWGGMSSL